PMMGEQHSRVREEMYDNMPYGLNFFWEARKMIAELRAIDTDRGLVGPVSVESVLKYAKLNKNIEEYTRKESVDRHKLHDLLHTANGTKARRLEGGLVAMDSVTDKIHKKMGTV